MPMHDSHTTVYQTPSGYTVCEDKWGGVLDESFDNPEEVIQTALDRKNSVTIQSGSYYYSNVFEGIFAKSDTVLKTDYGVKLYVPNGYDGQSLIFDATENGGTIKNFRMEGGLYLDEAGSSNQQFLWDAIRFNSPSESGGGITFSEFGNVHVLHANRAVCLNLQAEDSWMTSTKIKQIQAYYTKILFEILNPTNPEGTAARGFSTNIIENVTIQSNTNTSHGFKGMLGNNDFFTGCAVWDVQESLVEGGVISSQFLPSATNQYILGGIMTHSHFDNQAKPGQVRIMDGHGPVPMWDVLKQVISVSGPLNGSKVINIPHGMGLQPDFAIVIPKSTDAMTSQFQITSISTTNVQITYRGAAPVPTTPGNTNNLIYEVWTSVR